MKRADLGDFPLAWICLDRRSRGIMQVGRLAVTGGIRPGLMPPVTHNMILGMRAYHVVNRGIPACGTGIM